MRTVVVLVGVCISAAFSPASNQCTTSDTTCCSVVQSALADSRKIKPGMKRAEVEKYFTEEGGLQFREKSRYVHPACQYLKLEVEYELDRDREVSSPKDKSEDRLPNVCRLPD
jgi:hypothetical protein